MDGVKPTIYDIARLSQVSIATVSKVLNGTGRISEETRQRVMQAVEALGYERSTIATALAGKNTYTIGFLVPDVSNPFFSEILRGAEDAAFARGYSVLVCNTDHDPERERVYLRTLRQKQMDGLVIATGSTAAETVAELVAEGVRVVLLSREIEGVSVGAVTIDNVLGGELAARHLVELGHRRVGVIPEPLHLASSRDRLHGFERALRAAGAECSVAPAGGFGISAGARMAKQVLADPSITALFALNDQLAVGALEALRKLGKHVPGDVSVIGFDDTILAKIVHPALTTVAQPMQELGQRTLELLIYAIESGTQPAEKIVISPTLVVRGSTAPPPGGR